VFRAFRAFRAFKVRSALKGILEELALRVLQEQPGRKDRAALMEPRELRVPRVLQVRLVPRVRRAIPALRG
jgi:hypothetical protein